MAWLIIEALAALALLLFIVWWTMFSGRRKGERATPQEPASGAGIGESGGPGRPKE
ncbi:MAG: hypothetical protein JNJ71_05405 [Rubrivivax sp.]|nr:hypothetical protein [Rubrivivax sp.]